MEEKTIKHILTVAKEIAVSAGAQLLAKSNESHPLIWGDRALEGYKEIKSQADSDSDKLITASIARAFPDHSILSEESGFTNNDSDFTWIIDPLHDTVAYVRGNRPEFSVTIAVAKGDVVVCSVVYQPVLERLYWATKGGGAYLNGTKLAVSAVDSFAHANLSMQQNAFKYGEYQKLLTTITEVKRMYALGSAMFPELASGVVDIVVSYKQALYDYAATKLLVEEAGGIVTDDKGNDLPLYFDNERRFTIVATNGRLHEAFLERLR